MTKGPYSHLRVVLSPAQIGHWDLVCGFMSNYPGIRIIAQQPVPQIDGVWLDEMPKLSEEEKHRFLRGDWKDDQAD